MNMEEMASAFERTNAMIRQFEEAHRRHHEVPRFSPRAEQLLREHFDPEQLAEWDAGRAFCVTTPQKIKKRRYRLEGNKYTSNVVLVWGRFNRLDHKGRSFCINHHGWGMPIVPVEDLVLSQKLLLESPGGEKILRSIAY